MNVLAFGFGNLGGPDLIIILLIVLVLFGAKKIPELFKGLGQGMNEFRKAREEFDREIRTATTQDPKSQPPAVQQPQQTVPTQPSTQGQASGGQENTPQKPS
jgi:sec-independent protein translocase protein TatA